MSAPEGGSLRDTSRPSHASRWNGRPVGVDEASGERVARGASGSESKAIAGEVMRLGGEGEVSDARVVDEDKDRLVGGQADALPQHVHQLAHGHVHRDEVL